MISGPHLEAFGRWLSHPPPGHHRRPVRPRTVAEYVKLVQRSSNRGDVCYEALRSDVSSGYRQLARSAAIAWGRWQGPSAARAIEARLAGQWPGTPARRPRLPVDDAAKPAFIRLMKATRDPWRAVLELMWDGGLRLGDVLSITRASIAVGRASGTWATIGKGGRFLSYPYRELRQPLERLEHWQWNQLWQLLAPSSGAAERKVRRLVHRLGVASGAERPGRPVSPHILRHTAATDMMRATRDIHLTSRFLQHGSVETTESYLRGRPVDDLGRGMAAVRRMRGGS